MSRSGKTTKKKRPKKRAKKTVKKTTLRNGLTVLTERTLGYRSLAIGIWVRAGTRHERTHEAGISHFLEHMLFKGTETRTPQQITREVERVGGEFNAFTTREYTCFHITLLERDFDLGMEILSDIVMGATFDPIELERERKVILQEISMVEESPEEIAQDIFFELIYGRHSLGRSILGTANSVRNMRRSEILRYFKKHYRPDNVIVSVAGNVPHNKVMRSLKAFSKRNWPGRPEKRISAREEGFVPAPEIRDGLWWINRPTEQAHIVWGVESLKYTSRDQAACILLASYLGGGMSSYLFQEIRERNGLAYSIYSNLNSYLDSGVFSIYVGSAPSQVATCIRMIEAAAIRLATQRLSDEELQEVKDSLKGMMLMSSDSVESLMQSNAVDEIYFGKNHTIEEVCDEIDEVNTKDIRRMAKRLFGSGKRSILIYGPKPSTAVKRRLQPVFPKKYRSRKK